MTGNGFWFILSVNRGITDSIVFFCLLFLPFFLYVRLIGSSLFYGMYNSINLILPLNVCTKLLLIICQSCASPTCGAITKCCFDGAITIERITPVPVTVIVRSYWNENGNGERKRNETKRNEPKRKVNNEIYKMVQIFLTFIEK